jgi:hypothetical protein
MKKSIFGIIFLLLLLSQVFAFTRDAQLAQSSFGLGFGQGTGNSVIDNDETVVQSDKNTTSLYYENVYDTGRSADIYIQSLNEAWKRDDASNPVIPKGEKSITKAGIDMNYGIFKSALFSSSWFFGGYIDSDASSGGNTINLRIGSCSTLRLFGLANLTVAVAYPIYGDATLSFALPFNCELGISYTGSFAEEDYNQISEVSIRYLL